MFRNKLSNDFDISSQLYFNEIKKYKSLSLDEELSLWERYKKNNDLKAKEKIITSNLKFVASVAKNYQGRGLSYSDLIAEGNCGLIKAIDKFDYKKKYKTISYSVWWIRQSILEAIKERNNIKGDDLPFDYEKQAEDDDNLNLTTISYSSNFIDEDDNKVSIEEIKNVVSLLMDNLNKRERQIIKSYFGINCEMKTLEEIGIDLGLTKERVRQIKEKILKKLRAEALSNSITSDIYK